MSREEAIREAGRALAAIAIRVAHEDAQLESERAEREAAA
jgi:hypothetical protein